jgi:hypothetical protein
MGSTAIVQAASRRGMPLDLATTTDGQTLVVGIAGNDNGKTTILALEAVLRQDLTFARDETWWVGVRTGRLPADLNALSMKLIPGSRQKHHLVDGYTLELSDATHSCGHGFSVHSLSRTAQRALARLIQKKQLQGDTEVSYFLICQEVAQLADRKGSTAGDRGQDGEIRASTRHDPLPFEHAPLEEYLESSAPLTVAQAAEPVGQDTSLHMPVFFQEQVWVKGHQFARRGNDSESAGIRTSDARHEDP